MDQIGEPKPHLILHGTGGSHDASGHGTHTWPARYRQHLAAFLAEIKRPS